MKEKIHLCHLVISYNENYLDPNKYLEDLFTLTEWCEALVIKGLKVTAILRFSSSIEIIRNKVKYIFVTDNYGANPRPWQTKLSIYNKIELIKPDVIQAHNMNKPIHHWKMMRKYNGAISIWNHAELPSGRIMSLLQRIIYKKIKSIILPAPGTEINWIKKKILTKEQFYFIPEFSVHKRDIDKASALKITGLEGYPNCLWIGNLNKNKDPFTVLIGFKKIIESQPRAMLYMIYKEAPLLEEVKLYIKQNDLSLNVKLLGKKPRNELFYYYKASHYFFIGSYKEGTGYSAFEAASIGCIPILTEIPSFQLLSNYCTGIQLWNPGQSDSFIDAFNRVDFVKWNKISSKIKSDFHENLSYEILSDRLLEHYKLIIKNHHN